MQSNYSIIVVVYIRSCLRYDKQSTLRCLVNEMLFFCADHIPFNHIPKTSIVMLKGNFSIVNFFIQEVLKLCGPFCSECYFFPELLDFYDI